MVLPVSRSQAALFVLFVVQLVMLGALYAQVAPHPPREIPLFAMAPFLGASIAISGAGFLVGGVRTGTGCVLGLLAAVMALVSFGPQKWVDPAIGEIWPSVLVAEVAVIVIVAEICFARGARKAAQR